jgi:hypothetical protein
MDLPFLSSRLPRPAVEANSGFPTTQHYSTATYVGFFQESRMRLIETTKLDRKSGGSRDRDQGERRYEVRRRLSLP